MTIHFGAVPAGSILPIHFPSYNSAGASATLSGLAITDVEIYKGTSVTQRSSDNGIVLIDTDGIDIDSITGANGFSIDLSDDTDSGFYAIGSFYNVWVASVTIDGQTVNHLAATFRIVAMENIAGRPVVDAGTIPSETDIWSFEIEPSVDARQALRLANSANAGKLSGAATTTVHVRDLGDTKDRVLATVDASGNRTAVTLDLT